MYMNYSYYVNFDILCLCVEEMCKGASYTFYILYIL